MLDGKVALVTGAASGIGRATAERFAAESARVCVVDVDDEHGHAVAASIDGVFVPADAGDPVAVDAAFLACERELGGLDIAYLNAGTALGIADPLDIDDDGYRRIMRVNVDGVVFGIRAATRSMQRRGGGAIVATASIAGLVPFAPDPVYDLTKHAVVGFVRSVAPTLAARGISANAVCPGMTDTGLVRGELRARIEAAGFPLMPPSDIADAVLLIVTGGGTGECWVCQPGREPEVYRFHDVPGPRAAGARGRVPPLTGAREGSSST
jgi:NAD(P)-dependent dehydrogenase (short-subunit alcohol dehydrogenase family)